MIGKLLTAAVRTVSLPIAAVRDVVALSTGLSDESMTQRVCEDIGDDLRDARDDLADGEIL